MLKQFLIILMLLMTVSVFAGKKRVATSTSFQHQAKGYSCSEAKKRCEKDYKKSNETLVGVSSCECSKDESGEYWSCDVTCTYEKE